MTYGILPNGKQQFIDSNGKPLASGKVYYYIPSTTTFKNTYQNSAGTVLNTNPVVLDANGQCIAYGTGSYRQQVYDVYGNLIWDVQVDSPLTSGNQTYDIEEQTFTATSGQTVFTLTTMSYVPGTNNLVVFVDGLKQIVGVNYTETSSTVVTFTTGLHVGAVVDFTTAVLQTNANIVPASDVTYNQGGTGAVATTVQAKLQESVSVKDFGAKGDGTTDDTAAISNALASGASCVIFTEGTYKITSGFTLNNNNQQIIGQGNVTIRLYTSASSVAIFYLPSGRQYVTIENLTLQSNGSSSDGLYTYGILGTSFSYCWFNRITAQYFSGAGIEGRQTVYVTVNDYVAQSCFYGLSNQLNSGYGSSAFTLNGAYISNCTRGVTQTSGAMMTYNNFVLEYCGSNTTVDGALHLAGGGANCNNCYWEANNRNIVAHDAAFYLLAPYISTPGGAAPNVIDYSGTAYSDRGTLQLNPTTLNIRNVLPDTLSNYDLTVGTNLVAPLAGGSVVFGNETMYVASGTLTSATWTTVYTIPTAELSGSVNSRALYEYTCYAGTADLSTGFDSGTIMNNTLRSYSGTTPSWLRLNSNTVQMNVTASSYGLLYKIVMRRVYPG